ncbi:hypothetical protein PYW07_000208 [Mythimna separata]|uniref:Uncharacterized protein n=1 Tax=Mythimna separata TaxID=271217 RepID=A0AAD7Z1Q8_MYTSE|nr:hypothetical protein PYW07_000208 [Mythimna separata]
MGRISSLVYSVCLLQAAVAVKVKVVMHSEQEDSRLDEEERTEAAWPEHKRREPTMLPFIRAHSQLDDKQVEYDEEKITTTTTTTTEKPKQQHPNELIFPLIYRQSHVNSMFKFGENWYTWSTEKRADGSKQINYFICYDEPKRCDEIGWERTDTLPKCAFQIDSLLPEDRACINSFGVEPHIGGICDGAEQMKVVDMVRSCGPRIRSLWRFVRVGRRPANAAKPADVNSLTCEDEEECFLTIEYRIHHDRITFSLHEPTRGQTYKSVLKREVPPEEKITTVVTEAPQPKVAHRSSKKVYREEESNRTPKFRVKSKGKAEGKGIAKETNDSAYTNRRVGKNKIKVREDISDDVSE